MNYGLYLSAAGAQVGMHRQDVLANNLANVNTVGFKPDVVMSRQRLPERLEDPTGSAMSDPQWLLENLGGGMLVDPTRIKLRQGALTETGNELDLALEGDGFFVVSDGRGTRQDHERLTRDGRFTLNTRGELVMAGGGRRVLGENGRPIRLDRAGGAVRFGADGAIMQAGRAVGRLQIAAVSSQRDLVKVGDNLMTLKPGAQRSRQSGTAQVRQRHVETSAVDPIESLTEMMKVSKVVAANVQLMQYHDQIMGEAINTFGRVA